MAISRRHRDGGQSDSDSTVDDGRGCAAVVVPRGLSRDTSPRPLAPLRTSEKREELEPDNQRPFAQQKLLCCAHDRGAALSLPPHLQPGRFHMNKVAPSRSSAPVAPKRILWLALAFCCAQSPALGRCPQNPTWGTPPQSIGNSTTCSGASRSAGSTTACRMNCTSGHEFSVLCSCGGVLTTRWACVPGCSAVNGSEFEQPQPPQQQLDSTRRQTATEYLPSFASCPAVPTVRLLGQSASSIAHAEPCAQRAQGSQCQLQCSPGFSPAVICSCPQLAASVWQCEVDCAADSCPESSPAGTGGGTLPTSPYGTRQTVSCKEGYSGTSMTFVCGVDGTWAPVNGGTAQMQCNQDCPELPVGGVGGGVLPESKFNQRYTIHCKDGYSGGSVTFVCGITHDGKWGTASGGSAQMNCQQEHCAATQPMSTMVWVEGEKGNDCDTACEHHGGCVQDYPAVHAVGIQLLAANLGVTCSTDSDSSPENPCLYGSSSIHGSSSSDCYAQASSQTAINCAGKDAKANRFCPCGGWPAHATSCESGVYGADCKVNCTPGYYDSKAPVTYTCSGDSWKPPAGPALKCVKEVCPIEVPGIAHARDCKSNAVGDSCQVRCKNGYQGLPGTTLPLCTCDRIPNTATGQWKCDPANDNSCFPVSCPAEPPCANCEPCAAGKFQDGKMCHPECVAGYTQPAGYTADAYTCGSSGRWISGSSDCRKVCPESDPSNSMSRCSSGYTSSGGTDAHSTCARSCLPGFVQESGSVDYTCDASGSWIQSGTCGFEQDTDWLPPSKRYVPAANEEACCKKCRLELGCKIGVYVPNSGTCWLKTDISGGKISSPGSVSTTIGPLVCESVCHTCDDDHTKSCTDGAGARCVCTDNGVDDRWFGPRCGQKCEDTVCKHDGVCYYDHGVVKCRCARGWAGEDCTRPDLCLVGSKLKCLHGGQCHLSEKDSRGYTCECESGYEGENCANRVFVAEFICAIVTIGTSLSIPWFRRDFQNSLNEMTEPSFESPTLPPGEDFQGVFGLCMFLFGIGDLIIDILLSVSLAKCQQWWLFVCCTYTLVVTTCLTWSLGWSALRAVGTGSDNGVPRPETSETPEGRLSYADWIGANHRVTLATLIVLGSTSRLDSMAILRLRIGDRTLVEFPDAADHRFWFFLKHAGVYHYLIEDIPHAFISIALLLSDGTVSRCESSFELPISDYTIAILALVTSFGSMVFGFVRKSIQGAAQRRRRQREIDLRASVQGGSSDEGSNGISGVLGMSGILQYIARAEQQGGGVTDSVRRMLDPGRAGRPGDGGLGAPASSVA